MKHRSTRGLRGIAPTGNPKSLENEEGMRHFAQRVILSFGWERRAFAFVAGMIGVLALQPFGFVPAFFVPMTCAVWLLDGCSGKAGHRALSLRWSDLGQAADAGWWFGFGFFLAGLWWVGDALLVDAGDFAWALPFAVIGLPAGLAVFSSAGFVLARLLWSPGPARLFALAAGLGLSEYARGHLLTGFPWNAYGMALGGTPLLAQTASVYGLYGLTVVAVALFATPALFVPDRGFPATQIGSRVAPLLAILGWIALISFGGARLFGSDVALAPGVRLRIMQPNLAQDEKFRPENGERILGGYLALSDRATSPRTQGLSDVTHLIWPESAFPFILERNPAALAEIQQALPPKTILLTGAARFEGSFNSAQGRYFNSIQVVGPKGLLDRYDKAHLVPFGEYLPFEALLEKIGIQDVVRLPGGFTPGNRFKLLESPGLPPIVPLICYEAIFPIESPLDDRAALRPGLLLNLTNDGWFGRSLGPYQHFAQARLRAIEEGLPLIRAANTGISAVVDPYGRVLTQLPLGIADVLDSGLPQRIDPPIFARRPILSEFLVWIFAFAAAFLRARRR